MSSSVVNKENKKKSDLQYPCSKQGQTMNLQALACIKQASSVHKPIQNWLIIHKLIRKKVWDDIQVVLGFCWAVCPSRKRCRSHATTMPSSIPASGALVPTRANLLLPRKRFRDSYSSEDSVEEDIDADVLADIEADTTAVEVAADIDVEAGVVADIVDVVAKIDIPDEDIESGQRELEVRSLIAGGERDVLLDCVATLEMSNARLQGTLRMASARVDRLVVELVVSSSISVNQVPRYGLIIMTITRSGTTPKVIEELINQRVAEALATYEANRATELVVKSQSQNGDDGDNGNGRGNGNENGRGNGDGNGEGNGNRNRGGNGDGNPNRNDRDMLQIRELMKDLQCLKEGIIFHRKVDSERFLDNKLEEGERMWNSIQNGPYVRLMIFDPDGAENINSTMKQILEPLSKMTEGNKKQYVADVKVMNYLLQAIPNDIYNSVDACVKSIRLFGDRIKKLMFGFLVVSSHVNTHVLLLSLTNLQQKKENR
ncbi:hypothetical protein Tco_0109981 [Tanacetum coccineum]